MLSTHRIGMDRQPIETLGSPGGANGTLAFVMAGLILLFLAAFLILQPRPAGSPVPEARPLTSLSVVHPAQG
jgi:hypothetical protein